MLSFFITPDNCSSTSTLFRKMVSPRTTKTIFAALIVLAILVANGDARRLVGSALKEEHERWMVRYGRAYKDEIEKAMRSKIFAENFEYIKSFNEGKNHSYTLGVNEFSDLTHAEFLALYTGEIQRNSTPVSSSFSHEYETDIPLTMDWRHRGAVTTVKNQKKCGSCWAFAAVAAVESLYQIKTGQLVDLSVQQILDCDNEDHGCKGGQAKNALDFISSNEGLATDSDYPYTASQGTCKDYLPKVANILGYGSVQANRESSLLSAVAKQPIVVSIDSHRNDFIHYSEGIYMGEDCGTNLNHVVTVVGYGESYDGVQYWLIKNSWGTNWGEDGYMRIKRNSAAPGGTCGMAIQPVFPIAMDSGEMKRT